MMTSARLAHVVAVATLCKSNIAEMKSMLPKKLTHLPRYQCGILAWFTTCPVADAINYITIVETYQSSGDLWI